MNKEQAFDILKDAFNEFINSHDPDSPVGAYQQFCIKTSGTFVESGNALVGEMPNLPIATPE